MRVHLMRGPGRDDAIAYAIDVLLRVRFSIDIVEDDGTPDVGGRARATFLRSVQDDVSSAIDELRRVRWSRPQPQ